MDGEFYTTRKNTSRNYADRYKNCSVMQDNVTGEVLLSTRESVDIPEHPSDIYHRVHSNEVNRLDILAGIYYKNPLFWWVIAQANNIYNPFEKLAPGTLIRIPGIESLYGTNGILL